MVIVAIDDDSVKKVGRWPWSREDMARMLTRLKEAGPRVIALDIIFAEKEETASYRPSRISAPDLTRRGVSPEILILEVEENRADVDRHLAKVIKEGPPTILGFFFRGLGGKTGGVEAERLMGASFLRASTYNLVRLLDTEPSQVPLIGAAGVELNLPEITEAAAGDGYFNMMPDVDGTVRWFPMAILYGADFFAPMALVTLAHPRARPPGHHPVPVGGGRDSPGAADDAGGPPWPGPDQLPGPRGDDPHLFRRRRLDGSLPAEVLKDKIVMVGATAVGIYDLRVTPFSGIFPGVEIQATVIDNLLKGNFIRTPPSACSSCCSSCGLGSHAGRGPAPAVRGLGLHLHPHHHAAYMGFNYFLFSRLGLHLELFYPLGIVLIYLGVTMQRFLAEERERERIRKAFESYVAPTVVQEMLKHPEQLRLGGERREITVLFSDIRGFTTMSENMDPEALVRLLHDFLNPMSNIIINHGGTIDKYMGDAIMALFGAPLMQTDHPRLACRAALEMVASLAALNQTWASRAARR